jgi:hypothetical protein
MTTHLFLVPSGNMNSARPLGDGGVYFLTVGLRRVKVKTANQVSTPYSTYFCIIFFNWHLVFQAHLQVVTGKWGGFTYNS